MNIIERQEPPALGNAFDDPRHSEDRFKTMIDMIPSFAWCARADGSKQYLNQRWHEYTGLSRSQGNGWGWESVVHPEDLDPLLQAWRAIRDSGEAGEMEARIRRFDGV